MSLDGQILFMRCRVGDDGDEGGGRVESLWEDRRPLKVVRGGVVSEFVGRPRVRIDLIGIRVPYRLHVLHRCGSLYVCL